MLRLANQNLKNSEQLFQMTIGEVLALYQYQFDVESAERALTQIQAMHSDEKLEIGLGDPVEDGGFKQVYHHPHKPGYVIALRNLAVDSADVYMAKRWCEAVVEEKAFSDLCLAVGLQAQKFEIEVLKVNGDCVPVLVMPSFDLLSKNGLHVRDLKNRSSSRGNSLIFGSKENVTSAYLYTLLHNLLDDVALAAIHQMPLTRDTLNFAVEDTEKTPKVSPAQATLTVSHAANVNSTFTPYRSPDERPLFTRRYNTL